MPEQTPPDESPTETPAGSPSPEVAPASPPAEAAPASPPPIETTSDRNLTELANTVRLIKEKQPGKTINDEDILTSRERYVLFREKEIGTGSYAKYYQAQDGAGNPMAVKITPIAKASKRYKEHLLSTSMRIMSYLSTIKPKNIIIFYATYLSAQKVYVFCEHMKGGDLWKVAKDHRAPKSLKEEEIKLWIRQITEGLLFLYMNGIGHRNIGSESVVLNEDKSLAKITGFGYATITFDPNTNKGILSEKHEHFAVNYAPETLKGPYDPHHADMWGVGIIIIDLLTGKHPFGKVLEKDYDVATRNHFRKNLVNISQMLDAILKRLLEENPAKRCTPQELLASNWII